MVEKCWSKVLRICFKIFCYISVIISYTLHNKDIATTDLTVQCRTCVQKMVVLCRNALKNSPLILQFMLEHVFNVIFDFINIIPAPMTLIFLPSSNIGISSS